MPETLMQVVGWLFWPIAVFILIILVQLVLLLYNLFDCLTIVRYELLPVLKDIRLTASHVEVISERVLGGTQVLTQGVHQGRIGIQALLVGLKKSFTKK